MAIEVHIIFLYFIAITLNIILVLVILPFKKLHNAPKRKEKNNRFCCALSALEISLKALLLRKGVMHLATYQGCFRFKNIFQLFIFNLYFHLSKLFSLHLSTEILMIFPGIVKYLFNYCFSDLFFRDIFEKSKAFFFLW